MPKVSVILPNYNHANFLAARINSILNQTYQDFELIILDDFSTDDSKSIIESFKNNSKISHIIYNDVNSGSTFLQWKKGFSFASGEYIWIAESDDFCSIDFLENCMRVITTNSNISLVYTDSYFVDSKNEVLRECNSFVRKCLRYNDSFSFIKKNCRFIKENMIFQNAIINASAVVFKKECIPNNNDYLKYKYCGDWIFWTHVIAGGDVIHINKQLNMFRQHSNKVSPKSELKGLHFIEGFEVYNLIVDKYKINGMYKYISLGSFFYRIIRSRNLESERLKKEIMLIWRKSYPNMYLYILFYWLFVIIHVFVNGYKVIFRS